MDYNDMAESLRRKVWQEGKSAFEALPNKLYWDLAEIEPEILPPKGTKPIIAEYVEIARSMSQGVDGSVVSLMS